MVSLASAKHQESQRVASRLARMSSSDSNSAHGARWIAANRSDSENIERSVNSSPAADLKQQQPARSSSSESHTPTQRADSEDSGMRKDKETDNDTSTKEAQLTARQLSNERPSNIRQQRAGVWTPRYDRYMASRSSHANPQHTVNLTEAPTWHPTPKSHADRAPANRHTRGHPAGAHPTSYHYS